MEEKKNGAIYDFSLCCVVEDEDPVRHPAPLVALVHGLRQGGGGGAHVGGGGGQEEAEEETTGVELAAREGGAADWRDRNGELYTYVQYKVV